MNIKHSTQAVISLRCTALYCCLLLAWPSERKQLSCSLHSAVEGEARGSGTSVRGAPAAPSSSDHLERFVGAPRGPGSREPLPPASPDLLARARPLPSSEDARSGCLSCGCCAMLPLASAGPPRLRRMRVYACLGSRRAGAAAAGCRGADLATAWGKLWGKLAVREGFRRCQIANDKTATRCGHQGAGCSRRQPAGRQHAHNARGGDAARGGRTPRTFALPIGAAAKRLAVWRLALPAAAAAAAYITTQLLVQSRYSCWLARLTRFDPGERTRRWQHSAACLQPI